MKLTIEGTREVDGLEVQWTADVEVSYSPGRFYGPPEDCYPDESECDIIAVSTHPGGFEQKIPDEVIEDAAWAEFARYSEAQAESEAEARAQRWEGIKD